MVSRRKVLVILVSLLCLQASKGTPGSAFKDGSLDIRKDETLTIDTTSFKAILPDLSEITLGDRSDMAFYDDQGYTYRVAELKYTDSIIFQRGSKIIINGTHSLSIQSSRGNITIASELSVTCTQEIRLHGSDTCLGGYMLNYTNSDSCAGLFRGLGPGGNKNKACEQSFITMIKTHCNGGAGHGGVGAVLKGMPQRVGQLYGKKDFESLIGGSAGNTVSNETYLSGGGAIEVKAENGLIYIDAKISASASVMGNTNETSQPFSGSSGGLIRLKAIKVIMTNEASLHVDGGNGSIKLLVDSSTAGNGGGGGGVIQVNASQAQLYNLSLKAGSTFKCDASLSTTPGCLVFIKGPSEVHKTEKCQDFIPFYEWPEPPLSIDEQLIFILQQSAILKMKFKEENFKNISEIFVLLQQLQNICSQNDLTEPHVLKVLEIFESFKDILYVISHHLIDIMKEVFAALLKLATSIISSRNQKNWKATGKLPAFVRSLEEMGESIANQTTEYYNYTDLIAFQSISLEEGFQYYVLPMHAKLPKEFLLNEETFVNLSEAALPQLTRNVTFLVLIFKNLSNGLPEDNNNNRTDPHKVVTLLTTYSLLSNGRNIRNLRSPALLHFKLYKPGTNPKCSFWNTNSDLWDSEGLSTQWTSTTNTVCSTNHLTSFAVLMQFTKESTKLTKLEEMSLSLITYIGCSLSCFGFLVTLPTFLFMKSLSSERHRIHLNLVIALLLAQVVFLSGIKATEIKLVCQVIAGLLHYLFLASFVWMLLEGVHLYLKVVRVFGVENVKIRYYCMVGWGIPILIILVPTVLEPGNYGTKDLCWLSLEDGFVWAFIAPVLAVIAINSFILGIVIKTVMTSASAIPCSEYAHIKAGIKSAVVLMPLMGVTWVFGLLAVNRATLVFQYVFAITNSLQGFWIFLSHMVFNNEVRAAFKRHWQQWQLSRESADYNASFSATDKSKSYDSKDKNNKASGFSSSNSNAITRLKARLSVSLMPRTSRVISVQPFNSKSDPDDSTVRVERKFCNKGTPNRLSSPEQNISSLNSPIMKKMKPSYVKTESEGGGEG